jgi:hypothetical protein
MKEYERSHRVHREKSNPLCSQEEIPLEDITGSTIACAIEIHSALGLCLFEAQPLTYMKAMKKKIGLLINLSVEKQKNGIKKFIL